MELPPDVILLLDEMIKTPTDEGRIVLEQANMATPDSGLHEGDPVEQPDQTP